MGKCSSMSFCSSSTRNGDEPKATYGGRDRSYADLVEFIDEKAEQLDISAVPSKAAELHCLFDNARDSILALLAFARKTGVLLEDLHHLTILNSLLRDDAGKRTIKTWCNGKLVSIDVDDLDAADAARLALAEQCGVSEQELLRFEQRMADPYGACLRVPCNHQGCSMTKAVSFGNPAEMLDAERQTANEIWYCRYHREAAFLQGGIISDEFLPVLERIRQSPGLVQKDTGAKRDDIQFLQSVGLLTVEKVTYGTRLLCYQITLTDEGHAMLDKLSVAVAVA